MGETPGGGPTRRPQPNIYTVLALIAVVALLIGIVYVAYKNTQATGKSNPFYVVQSRPVAVATPVAA